MFSHLITTRLYAEVVLRLQPGSPGIFILCDVWLLQVGLKAENSNSRGACGVRALLFVRQADMVMLGCADVTALTNMLAHTEGDVARHEREALRILGKTVGYDIYKDTGDK